MVFLAVPAILLTHTLTVVVALPQTIEAFFGFHNRISCHKKRNSVGFHRKHSKF